MSLLTIKLDDYSRTLATPNHAAAYALVWSEDKQKVTLIIRMKVIGEHSALQSMQSAKKELPLLTWEAVSLIPESMTQGGVPKAERFRKIVFVKNGINWVYDKPISIGFENSAIQVGIAENQLTKDTQTTDAELQALAPQI
jgi:hypothetical protein